MAEIEYEDRPVLPKPNKHLHHTHEKLTGIEGPPEVSEDVGPGGHSSGQNRPLAEGMRGSNNVTGIKK